MHDDQLREQFTRWAQPLQAARPPALPVLRERARRRAARRGAAVSALAVLSAAVVFGVSAYPRASHAHSTTPTVRGVPRYAVVLQHGGQAAAVLNMVTGKVLGKVTMPGARADFQWVAAAADDHTFVLAGQAPVFTVRFYVLHLGASGKPGQLAPLKVPPLHGAQVYGMALTADASKLAVAWQQSYMTGPVTGRISVSTLSTGATRTWSSAHGSASTVSWAGDHTLAFTWQDVDQEARSGVRLLDTEAAGASLLASRLLIPASVRVDHLRSPGNPVVTQDGSTLFATMAFGGTRTAIVRFSARTGEFLAVLVPPVISGANPGYCGVLWTDPHGRHLLTQCGPIQASIEGYRSAPAHLHQFFPASPVGFANTFAW